MTIIPGLAGAAAIITDPPGASGLLNLTATNAGQSTSQTTIAGTTAGSAYASQAIQLGNFKIACIVLVGYRNSTGTAQTWTFPTAFSQTPGFAMNSDPESSASTTTLTLPASMSAASSGIILLVGF